MKLNQQQQDAYFSRNNKLKFHFLSKEKLIFRGKIKEQKVIYKIGVLRNSE